MPFLAFLQVHVAYNASRRTQEGKGLADSIWETEDTGYYSDVEDARRWAEELGLDGWSEWRRLTEVHATRSSDKLNRGDPG